MLLLAAGVAGCGQVVRQGGFADVQTAVAMRGVSQPVQWHDGSADDRAAEDAVRELLARDLTPDAAVQIALLENPSLQASYEDLGIAQANLVQAGLLKNPVFLGAVLFGNVSPAYDFDVTQNFLDTLLIPARKRIASAQFEEARLRVAGEVFDLTAKVREAYYRLQGAEQLVEVLEAVLATTEAATQFAARLHAAGNLSDLGLASERALLEEVRADVLRARADTVEPRERLRRLLGLSDSERAFRVPAGLPGLAAADPSLSALLELARSQRLEIAAARQQQTALTEALETVRFWRYLGSVDVGVDNHKEQGEKNWIVGPSVSLDLPIFDQRQAEIARLESELRQSERRTEALTLDVSADVRRSHGKLRAARALAEHYRDALIPARERVVALSQQLYNFMLLGTPELLLAKRTEIAAYRDYVGAVGDYWIEVAELEKAVGARIPIHPPDERPAMPAAGAMDGAPASMHQHGAPAAPAPKAASGAGTTEHGHHRHGGH